MQEARERLLHPRQAPSPYVLLGLAKKYLTDALTTDLFMSVENQSAMNPSSSMNPEALSASELLQRAMAAHVGNEKNLEGLLNALMDPASGKVIHLPGNPKALRVSGPSEREIQQVTVQAMRVLFQSVRLLMVAVESIDLRLRGSDMPATIHPGMHDELNESNNGGKEKAIIDSRKGG